MYLYSLLENIFFITQYGLYSEDEGEDSDEEEEGDSQEEDEEESEHEEDLESEKEQSFKKDTDCPIQKAVMSVLNKVSSWLIFRFEQTKLL